ncbi:hypothetical protein EUX98_g4329 [Antrodiella citrinella]|uniref:Uncharacterized protein n=1 Tax=Antrodiella citrinella TaxID=2447956 RepID=A0A4S4MU77_9APHY|nr:hypothetical protein EUX98_g4329 [Antrodiella citrinella]
MPVESILSEKGPLLARRSSQHKQRYVLVIHGGAGTMSRNKSTPEQRADYKAALGKALRAGYAVLQEGGEAMDAAVAAVSVMEDCPLFNSGKGAVFNLSGKNELETSIMLSTPPSSHPHIPTSRRGFGITLLRHVRNPSQLARALYLAPTAAPHTMLSDATAEKLGEELGIKLVDESYFWTENRWREHRRGLGLPEDPLPGIQDDDFGSGVPMDLLPKGTVGAVALDMRGCISAVTSTGGRTNKLVGRIGDTPSVGSGFWAEEWEVKGWLRRKWRTIRGKPTRAAVGISGTGDGDDTAPDVYETDDVFPSTTDNRGDSSEDESGAPTRHPKTKNIDGPSKEELDTSSLMPPDEANKKFRKAEKKHHRPRIQYTYPPSPTSSGRTSPALHTPALPLSHRLRNLQAELAALETELADPANPLLHKEREEGHVDPGELIRGMVDVKGRLEKISKLKEGRAKLVSTVMGEEGASRMERQPKEDEETEEKVEVLKVDEKSETRDMAQIDQRLGELEKVIGSSSTTLDEMSPLPPPLLPLLTRLNTQLTLLTQPRHIDSISRRLKLLLSDLDRQGSPQPGGASPASQGPAAPSPLQEQLTPVLTRLAPLLPHIPHILTRLRTLSALHTSAASFQSTLESLEEEQKRGRAALEELLRAVDGVEKSLEENENVVKKNVTDLEERIEEVGRKVEDLKISHHDHE